MHTADRKLSPSSCPGIERPLIFMLPIKLLVLFGLLGRRHALAGTAPKGNPSPGPIRRLMTTLMLFLATRSKLGESGLIRPKGIPRLYTVTSRKLPPSGQSHPTGGCAFPSEGELSVSTALPRKSLIWTRGGARAPLSVKRPWRRPPYSERATVHKPTTCRVQTLHPARRSP